jgi:hypothetical protein
MTKVDVFIYVWDYWDFYKDEVCRQHSEHLVTIDYVKERAGLHPERNYEIVPDTKHTVDNSNVIDGVYHHELETPTFQITMKP